MATTVKSLLNRVLRNLGEDEIDGSITTLTDDYHKLVLGFLNTIKAEVEAAHQWTALHTTNTVVLTAGQTSVDVTWANDKSRPVRINDPDAGIEFPLVFDVTNVTNSLLINEVPVAILKYHQIINYGTTQPYVSTFALTTLAGVLKFLTEVACTVDRTVSLTLVVPQARFGDGDLSVNIAIPDDVLELGVTWYAMEERGEELGTNGLFNEARYRAALDAAISTDAANQGIYNLVPA